MLNRRKLFGWEKTFFNAKAFVQFAMKFKNPKDLEIAIPIIQKCTAGFSHATDGDYIYQIKPDSAVYKLPDNMSAQDLCQVMYNNYTRPMDQTLASLGANKDTVVLNVNHMAGDGGFVKNLFEYVKANRSIDYKPTIIPIDKVFEKEIDGYNGELPPTQSFDTEVTRFFAKRKDLLHYTGATKMIDMKSDAREFMTYKLNGKLKNLTDYYWANIVLGFAAYNNKFDQCGVVTCINTRQFLKNPYDFNFANNFSQIRVMAKDITKNNTVAEMMKHMRNDFQRRVKNGEQYSGLKAVKMSYIAPNDIEKEKKYIGNAVDLSLIGTFDLGNKFDDVWVDFKMNEDEIKHLNGYLSFSIIKNGINNIYGRFRTATSYLSEKEAKVVGNSIEYGMKVIHPQMKIGEALDVIKDYQIKLETSLE